MQRIIIKIFATAAVKVCVAFKVLSVYNASSLIAWTVVLQQLFFYPSSYYIVYNIVCQIVRSAFNEVCELLKRADIVLFRLIYKKIKKGVDKDKRMV